MSRRYPEILVTARSELRKVLFWRRQSVVFTARRNARIASDVLATAIPSVCPSVTRRYCVKTTARSTVQFGLSDSKMCLVLYKPKKYSPGTTPSP